MSSENLNQTNDRAICLSVQVVRTVAALQQKACHMLIKLL